MTDDWMTRRDVERILGFSTKALRGYAELGMVKPVQATENGPLMYDRQAYRKLILIGDLVEVGIPRNEIRKWMEDQLQPAELMDRAIAYLRKRKRELEDCIYCAKGKLEIYRSGHSALDDMAGDQRFARYQAYVSQVMNLVDEQARTVLARPEAKIGPYDEFVRPIVELKVFRDHPFEEDLDEDELTEYAVMSLVDVLLEMLGFAIEHPDELFGDRLTEERRAAFEEALGEINSAKELTGAMAGDFLARVVRQLCRRSSAFYGEDAPYPLDEADVAYLCDIVRSYCENDRWVTELMLEACVDRPLRAGHMKSMPDCTPKSTKRSLKNRRSF